MGALNSLIKVGNKALTTGGSKAIQKATSKAIGKAVEDSAEKIAAKALSKAVSKSGASELSKLISGASLSGAGKSSMASKAGSTLDGILGKSSGIKLPNATKKTLKDYDITLGDIVEDMTAKDLKDSGVSQKTISKMQNIAREGADINNAAFENNAFGVANKSNLPMLNRDQYYYDTIGKVGKNGSMRYADVPEHMRSHLSNSIDKSSGNDSILREFFGDYDNEYDLNELYDRYDKLAQSASQNQGMTRADIEMGLGARGDAREQASIEQELADVFFGNKKNIPVAKTTSKTQKVNVMTGDAMTPTTTGGYNTGDDVQFKSFYGGTDHWFDGKIVDKGGKQYIVGNDYEDLPIDAKEIQEIRTVGGSSNAQPAKKIKIDRPQADLGDKTTITDTVSGVGNEDALRNEISSLREKIGASNGGSNMGGNGGGNTTAFANPEDDGFKIKLKNGETTNIDLANSAQGSTKQQRAYRNLDDMTAKSMNASSKQYKKIVDKSGSIDGYYKTVAERMRAEKIDQANVGQKAQTALAGREDIKQQGLQYAERNGVTINLSNVDNSIGLSAAQKRKLDELGLGLRNMLGDWSGAVAPTQAEEIYKTLRDYAYNWSDSKDALTKMAGNACEKEAMAVRDAIDKTMDNINVDYKTPLVEFMATNGENPAYIRKVAGKADFKFSDLRKDQSDWIAMNDLAGNKIEDDPTINLFGVDTGVPNPFTAGAEKIKEKFYERQAYGAGGGSSGGSVPPNNGASGAENNINFNEAPQAQSRLSSLLSKGKDTALIGGGILGGLLLGGGGSNNNTGNAGTLGDMLQSQQMASGSASTLDGYDPTSQMTIGGYTYAQLEQGYMNAIQAGDTSAAKLIQQMMEMLDDKISRYYTAQKNSTSSSTTNQNSKSALNVLEQLYGLYENIQGGTGPIQGNITNLLNEITGGGYNTEANTYWQVAQGALGKMIKGMGDAGALSEGDQQRALKMIPNVTDTREAAEAKFKALYQILAGASQA